MREVENDGSFLLQVLSDHDMVSKTLPGDVFSSTITHMKIFREFMKNFFVEILAFFQILLIFTYTVFSSLNYVQKMTQTKIEQKYVQMNRFFQIKMIKFEQIMKSIFQNLIFHIVWSTLVD